jgi:hypothetical protein
MGQSAASTGGVKMESLGGQPTQSDGRTSDTTPYPAVIEIGGFHNTTNNFASTDFAGLSIKRNTAAHATVINNFDGDQLTCAGDATTAVYAWDIISGSNTVLTTSQCVPNRIATLNLNALNQFAANTFAGVSACSSSTKAITFTAFTSQPVILVFDESTKGGANLSAKSTSGFTVSCTGASDIFDWQVIGNPN